MFFPPFPFSTHTSKHTHFPLAHTHTPMHAVMPAGRWWLAWCCHQGMQGAVCRKARGVNWVSVGCKAFLVEAWCSVSWCFAPSHLHHIEIQVEGKVKRNRVMYFFYTLSFTAALWPSCLFSPLSNTLWYFIRFKTRWESGGWIEWPDKRRGVWLCWPGVNRFMP